METSNGVLARILEGDCRQTLSDLADASVHCVVTSPPYFGLRDYGCAGQIGLEASLEEYLAALVAVFREVRRVLRRDGTLWLNLGDVYNSQGGHTRQGETSQRQGRRNVAAQHAVKGAAIAGLKPKDLIGLPWRLAFALQADGWYLRSAITWCKPGPMPESVRDRPTSATEMLFLLAKQPRYFYDAQAIAEPCVSDHGSGNGFKREARLSFQDDDGARGSDEPWTPTSGTRNRRNWWVIGTDPYPGDHFATFPQALVRPCVLAGTSAYGCCPECGAPWERVVEKAAQGGVERSVNGREGLIRNDTAKHAGRVGEVAVQTTGWRPTCAHEPLPPEPCRVLDPFAGTGTTGVVALSLGRRAILCELSPKYVKQIHRRLNRVQLPLPETMIL